MNELKKKANTFLLHLGTSKKKVISSEGPVIFTSAKGCYLYDENGKEYIDALSGSWVVNSGHGQQDIIQGIVEQFSNIAYSMSSEGYANDKAITLAEKLSELLPGGDKCTYFTSGGSEAVEIALRLARIFHKINGKRKKNIIVARHGSYHGGTLLALSISGYDLISKSAGPVPGGIEKISHPYCHRCKYNNKGCNLQCAYELEDVIKANGPEAIAAFIAEPISAHSGIAIPPLNYWKVIRNICDKYRVLLIVDEVLTGFCRTGKFFAIEHFDVIPDIIVMSKGLTSGYAPLGAVSVSKDILSNLPDNSFRPHGFIYSGHPISCAAALSNLFFMSRNNLDKESARKGAFLLSELRNSLVDNQYISDIRGIGLLICIELKGDKKFENAQRLTQYFLSHGVYTRIIMEYVHIAPPLTIPDDVLKKMAEIIIGGFTKYDLI